MGPKLRYPTVLMRRKLKHTQTHQLIRSQMAVFPMVLVLTGVCLSLAGAREVAYEDFYHWDHLYHLWQHKNATVKAGERT